MNTKSHKQQLLDQLYAPYKACMACPLSKMGRTQVVFGSGNPDTKILFIGEGPGAQEDLQGKPFVGRSGKLLDKIFEIIGTNRQEIYITNVVKCRPPDNRTPLPNESEICKRLLLFKQIQIIQPTVICTLGAAAAQALMGANIKISQVRGRAQTFEGKTLIPTYHPAYILRNPTRLQTLIDDMQEAYNQVIHQSGG